jgi:osmoprotectant transport system substrate-binding protein
VITRKTRRAAAALSAAIVAGAALAACSSSNSSGSSGSNPLGGGAAPTGSIVVGSDNFPESELLAYIYGETLAAKGYKVSYKLDIASREVTYGLLKSGTITMKPEYNGALLSYLDSIQTPKQNNPQTSTSQVDAAIAKELDSNLEILDPATAQDNDTLTLSKNEAGKLGLKSGASIADFVAALKGAPVTVGAAPEFQTRYQGIMGLEQAYGLKASQINFKSLDAGGTLTETALTSGAVDAGDLFTTDPTITQGGLLTLTDPKNIFGLQNVLPLINKTAINSAGISALNAVDAKLDSQALLALDVKTQVQKADPNTVAHDWLTSEGLI